MKNLVLSLGTIAYTHTISFTHISVSTGPFIGIMQISQFFVCISPRIWRAKHPNFFLKNIIRTFVLSWKQSCILIPFFEAHLRIYMPFFRNSINSSITPWIWIPKHPKLFFSKYFMRKYLLSNHHVYSHYFFISISSITRPFLVIA